MKFLTLIFLMFFFVNNIQAQMIAVDPWHFEIVNENGVVREAAETSHKNFLDKIDSSLTHININLGSVVLAQNMIYSGLSNVNSALKNGLAVKNMAFLIKDIASYSNAMVTLAKDDPVLILFAEASTREMETRGAALVAEVSTFILKEGNNVLMDYNSRDELLRNVTQQLQIIDGLAYGGWRGMYWAKFNGVFKSLNPYQGFINQDKNFVNSIISKSKYIK